MPNASNNVVIIGAGVAGCIAALALADTYSVSIIDKHASPKLTAGESLPPAARRILQKLGIFDAFLAEAHLVSQGMQSQWGSEQIHIVDHLRNPDGLGWHLDRQRFEQWLRQQLHIRQIPLITSTELVNTVKNNEQWEVEVKHLETDSTSILPAKYLIDASGRHCKLARHLGIRRQQDDKLVACWMTLYHRGHLPLGLVASSQNGWWYLAPLPLPQHQQVSSDIPIKEAQPKQALAALCYFSDADLLPNQRDMNIDFLCQHPEQPDAIHSILKQATQQQFHGCVAANSSHLHTPAGDGWFAIGDAALSFDPLSSQGMFNAMATAMQLADSLKTHPQHSVTADYIQQIQQIRSHYLMHKQHFYAHEQRWPENPFWKRRSTTPQR